MTQKQTTLLDGRVALMQSTDGLRASMDSVLLAASVQAKAGDVILDMGCGTGAVGLCVCARIDGLKLSGIDIQPDMIDLAKQNAPSASYVVGDVSDKHIFDRETFDHIVMNPPYYDKGVRQTSPDIARETAFTGVLGVWISSATHWLKQGGTLSMIHRVDALDDILYHVMGRYGAIKIWPIYTKPNEDAKRVVILMVRNRKTPLSIRPPIVMFDADGMESAQSKSILRDGAVLV